MVPFGLNSPMIFPNGFIFFFFFFLGGGGGPKKGPWTRSAGRKGPWVGDQCMFCVQP